MHAADSYREAMSKLSHVFPERVCWRQPVVRGWRRILRWVVILQGYQGRDFTLDVL